MKVSEVFSGDYLKAEHLNGGEHSVVIADVKVREFEDGNKFLITFQGRKKGLVANKTNSNRIAAAYGDETEGWIGKEIILYPEEVTFQGKTMEAIRVRPPARKPISQQAAPKAGNGSRDDDMNDAIPF